MIKVFLKTESHYPCNRKKIKTAVAQSLAGRVYRDAEVSVSVVGDRRMKLLNKKFRHLDKTTDVLSFPLEDPTQPVRAEFIAPPDNILRVGDIVISYPQAVKYARTANKLVDDVIIELALHGLNHLMGIHHPE